MRNPDREFEFRFKQFSVVNKVSAMKVGTDGVLLGAWAFRGVDPLSMGRVLDVGCGSGIIALMLAQRFAHWEITGIDIMSEAIYESELNFRNSIWSSRLRTILNDFTLLKSISRNLIYDSFDFIISNPPFFNHGDLSPDMARRTARHEGSLNYMSLINVSGELLANGGRLALISTAETKDKIISEGLVNYLYPQRVCMVSTIATKAPKRIMIEFIKGDRNVKIEEDNLIIHSVNEKFTDKYIDLVSDFYLHL